MAGRHRGSTGAAAAVVLALAGAALSSAAPAAAEPTGPADKVDNVGAPAPDPAAPCPVPGPVGPPGVTDVPSAFGAVMNLWRQARTPAVDSAGAPLAPPPPG